MDVDGTLLPEKNGKVLDSTKEAVRLLQQKDIGVALCTGRHPSEIQTLGLLDVAYDGFVLLNGQLVLDSELKKFYSHPIVGDEKEELLKLFNGQRFPVVLVEETRLF